MFAFENPPRIDATLTIGIGEAGAVAHQAAGQDELALRVGCRHSVAHRQRRQQP
jgi:hypothetical protein